MEIFSDLGTVIQVGGPTLVMLFWFMTRLEKKLDAHTEALTAVEKALTRLEVIMNGKRGRDDG